MIKVLAVAVTVLSMGACAMAQAPDQGRPGPDAYNGWHLAVQAWSFNRFTLYEAIEKTAALGWAGSRPIRARRSAPRPGMRSSTQA